jgi:hypothetical protein
MNIKQNYEHPLLNCNDFEIIKINLIKKIKESKTESELEQVLKALRKKENG